MNQILEIKHAHYFNLLDTNHDGVLNESDFLHLSLRYCSAFGLQTSSRWYSSIQSIFLGNWKLLSESVESKKAITKEQWLQFTSNHLITQRATYQSFVVNQTKLLIDLFDTNRDGYLQFNEYIDMLKCYNINTQSALDSFKILDLNYDKKLSHEEIIQSLRQYFTSTNPNTPGNHFFGVIPEIQNLTIPSDVLLQQSLPRLR